MVRRSFELLGSRGTSLSSQPHFGCAGNGLGQAIIWSRLLRPALRRATVRNRSTSRADRRPDYPLPTLERVYEGVEVLGDGSRRSFWS